MKVHQFFNPCAKIAKRMVFLFEEHMTKSKMEKLDHKRQPISKVYLFYSVYDGLLLYDAPFDLCMGTIFAILLSYKLIFQSGSNTRVVLRVFTSCLLVHFSSFLRFDDAFKAFSLEFGS